MFESGPGATRHASHGGTWSLGDRKTNKRRIRWGVAWCGGEGGHCFFLLEQRSALVPLNIVGHFVGFRAVIWMNTRLTLQWCSCRLSRPAQKQHTIFSSCVKAVCNIASCEPQLVPYRGGLGGVSALALLLQTSDELILGAHDGCEGSIFLLQLPVVTGHLQRLTCCTIHDRQDAFDNS